VRLLWQGSEAIVQVNYRPILSSERVAHLKKSATVREIREIRLWDIDGIPTPRQTGRLFVGRKLTSTSTSIIAFNANYIWRQCYGLSKQLKYLHIDVALFSETSLKPNERFYILNYHLLVYRIDRHPERKGGTAIAVRKGIPHRQVNLPPLVSIEATGICIQIGNCEVLLAAVYKSPNRTWCDIGITELLRFRNKCILACDLNAKHPFRSSTVSNPSGAQLLQLFDVNDFEISVPQSPTHYSPAGNGDVNLSFGFRRVSENRATKISDSHSHSDILDSDHLTNSIKL
jgi:hypothetical protein